MGGSELKTNPNIVSSAAELQTRAADWNIIRPLLIASVRSQNVTGYEEGSIFEGVRIALGATKAPEALDRYYHAERRSTGETLPLYKNGTAILRIFDESGGTLLIQGEPGSGKSYTLHQLAARLLQRAGENPDEAVPVVVPLASWAVQKLPLDQWLAGELSLHYRLSAKDTPLLLAEGGRLALLLDGLDEVGESARVECLKAIQKFMSDFRAPIAICCRAQEYRNLSARLAYGESIRLLPLTPEQVDAYLAEFDSTALAPLRELLKADAEWSAIASTPLMLGIMARVYAAGGQVPQADLTQETKRDALWDYYVREMFTRKANSASSHPLPKEASFTHAQAIHWLQQLAWKLAGEPTFFIERLQPRWVNSRWCYGVIVGLIVGLIFGLIGGSVDMVESVRFRWDLKELIGWLIGGLIVGLIVGLFELRSLPEPLRPNQAVRNSLRNSLLYGGFVATLGASIGFVFPQVGAAAWAGVFFGFYFFGGEALIRHYAIRLVLAWEGALPHPLSDRKLIAFLDGMRDRMLLRRPAGKGGWDFIHRDLQEFLARKPFGHTPAEVRKALNSRTGS